MPETFDHYYVSMVLPPDSPLREPLNRAILKFMDTDKWQIFVKKYLG